MEQAKTNDVVASGLIARPNSEDAARAMGKYFFECYDKDGNLKWTAESKNLVVNVGLQYMAGAALTGTSVLAGFYVGLYGAGASNTPAASDTMSSHAGWTEVYSQYSNATRPAAVFVAPSATNPAVVTNSASKATFTISGSATVGGAFLVGGTSGGGAGNADQKNGTGGTLFSASDFTGGDRSVVNGDTLQVTYTFSLSA
jgi:hypothetical protein